MFVTLLILDFSKPREKGGSSEISEKKGGSTEISFPKGGQLTNSVSDTDS